jgi:hypothetical protein
MSIDTYNAVPKINVPPRHVQIENVIRKEIEKAFGRERFCSNEEARGKTLTVTRNIMNELQDTHLIGLPAGPGSRTSVSCELMQEIGASLFCSKSEDADDIAREVIKFIRKPR